MIDFLTAPICQACDPELATHRDADGNMVYLSLGRTQLLQIIRTDFYPEFEADGQRLIHVGSWVDQAISALDTHLATINAELNNAVGGYYYLGIEGAVAEGAGFNTDGILPTRKTFSYRHFEDTNPYITENFNAGVFYLHGRMIRFIQPTLVDRVGEGHGEEVHSVVMAGWLSEVGVGFDCEARLWNYHTNMREEAGCAVASLRRMRG